MTPFGIVVWQQPMPEQDPSTPSLIVSHKDMHPVVYADSTDEHTLILDEATMTKVH